MKKFGYLELTGVTRRKSYCECGRTVYEIKYAAWKQGFIAHYCPACELQRNVFPGNEGWRPVVDDDTTDEWKAMFKYVQENLPSPVHVEIEVCP